MTPPILPTSGGVLSFSFTWAHELQALNGYVLFFYCFLHAELVALEELPAGVAGAVALEELLGEPAVEALVVLALQLGARLAHAVHRGGRAGRAGPGRARRH